MLMLSIQKLSANWRRLQQRFGIMSGIALDDRHSFRVFTRNKTLTLVVFGELSASIQLPSWTARGG